MPETPQNSADEDGYPRVVVGLQPRGKKSSPTQFLAQPSSYDKDDEHGDDLVQRLHIAEVYGIPTEERVKHRSQQDGGRQEQHRKKPITDAHPPDQQPAE